MTTSGGFKGKYKDDKQNPDGVSSVVAASGGGAGGGQLIAQSGGSRTAQGVRTETVY